MTYRFKQKKYGFWASRFTKKNSTFFESAVFFVRVGLFAPSPASQVVPLLSLSQRTVAPWCD
jgi:hypothetical protein